MSAATAAPEARPATTNDPRPAPGDAAGSTQPNGGTGTGKTFTQAELDAIVKDRLEREQRKRADAEAKARADAEAEALAKNQEYKALAEKHAARITELEERGKQIEPLTTERDRYAAAVADIAKQRREGIPDAYGELLDRMAPLEQLEWLNKHPELFERPGPTAGINPVPRAAGNPTREHLLAQEMAAQRRRRGM